MMYRFITFNSSRKKLTQQKKKMKKIVQLWVLMNFFEEGKCFLIFSKQNVSNEKYKY